MTTTFKELPLQARFYVHNPTEIIFNRGDGVKPHDYGSERHIFQKRDKHGGHILMKRHSWEGREFSVYYRIEPDNVVETV